MEKLSGVLVATRCDAHWLGLISLRRACPWADTGWIAQTLRSGARALTRSTTPLPFSYLHLESECPPAVLLVEDEPTLPHLLARKLTDDGFDVTVRDNGLAAHALVELSELPIDVVVSGAGPLRLRGDKLVAELRRVVSGRELCCRRRRESDN